MSTAVVYLKTDEMKVWQRIQANKLAVQKLGENWWEVKLGFRDYFNLNTILEMENAPFRVIGEMKGDENDGRQRYFSLTKASLSTMDKRFVDEDSNNNNWYMTFSSPCPPEFGVKVSKFMENLMEEISWFM